MKNRSVFALLCLSFFGSSFSHAADHDEWRYRREYPSLQQAYPTVYQLQLPKEKDFKVAFSKLDFHFVSNCGEVVFDAFYPKSGQRKLTLIEARWEIENIMSEYEAHFQNSSLEKSALKMITNDTKLRFARIIFQNHELFLKDFETQIKERAIYENFFHRDDFFSRLDLMTAEADMSFPLPKEDRRNKEYSYDLF